MDANVMKLASGHLSLEFSAENINEIKRVAKMDMGGVSVRRGASYDVVTICSCDFVSEVEYGEASLISDSDQCDEVIRDLYHRVTGKKSPS